MDNMTVNVSIIIPTYNRKDYLKVLLNQIEAQDVSNNIQIEIVVVVDGSADGTSEMLTKHYPGVHVIHGTGDWWYTKSMNEGFAYATNKLEPDYILILNDDLELKENFIQVMINDMEKINAVSILGVLSLTYSKPRRISSAGVKEIIVWRNKLVQYYDFLEPFEGKDLKGIHKSIVLPGRGMLIPIEILTEINYFDETFKQYFSDFDFCLRANEKGYESYITWNTNIYSHVKLTSSSSSFIRSDTLAVFKDYFNPYSRIHILSKIRYLWRHGNKFLLPITFLISFLASIKHIFSRKTYDKVNGI